MIRVLIKASSRLAQAGLESLLRALPALQVVEDSTAGPRRGQFDSSPDVLLVEAATLADPAAREALDWASAGGPVVLLLRHPATEPLTAALRAGVKGVLSGGSDGPEIAAAIESAAAGLEALLPFSSVPAGGASAAPAEDLTPREREVLRLLAAGLGNKEIASRLQISEHTAKFHVASIMGKLGASSRTEAVTLGIRSGLIMI